MLDFIPDGYTESGFIQAVAGLHGEFRFSFRPMLIEERSVILSERMTRLPEEQQDLKTAKAMQARLVTWSLRDAQGACVPIELGEIRRLKPALFRRLFLIVAGLEPSDPTPESPSVERLIANSLALDAALAGVPIGELSEERDRKNSLAG